MSIARDPHGRGVPRLPYMLVMGVLFASWAAVLVCAGVVYSISAWRNRSTDAATVVSPTATAPPSTGTPAPRPGAVPPSARLIEGTFDTGDPKQHLFFHIGCDDGVLAVVTTSEQLYAESSCETPIPQTRINPFLGMPVRITISDGRLDLSPAAGNTLTFSIGRVWVVEP